MPKVLEISAVIIGSNPPIGRVVQIDGDTNLQIIHEVMQALFNWGNIHLHYFRDSENSLIKDEEFTLLENTIKPHTPIVYVYDYGDSWTIELELLSTTERSIHTRPICVDGKRQSPPEDCGGMVGYEDSLDLLARHNKNELRKYPLIAEWYGEDYDPELFDISMVNSRLANIVMR